MSATHHLAIVVGVRIGRDALQTPGQELYGCGQGHTVRLSAKYCQECGRPLRSRRQLTNTALLQAIEARFGESEYTHLSTGDNVGVGLYPVGYDSMPDFLPNFGWVVGYRLAIPWEEEPQSYRMADLQTVFAEATEFCVGLGLPAAAVRLHVCAWLS